MIMDQSTEAQVTDSVLSFNFEVTREEGDS
jgi:hypothetical protein